MMAVMGMNHLIAGTPPGRAGNAHQNIVPYQVFACADGHLILAVGNDGQFAKFCALAGRDEWARDERFAMLLGMQAGMPPEAFLGVLDIARRTLSAADYAKLARALEVSQWLV